MRFTKQFLVSSFSLWLGLCSLLISPHAFAITTDPTAAQQNPTLVRLPVKEMQRLAIVISEIKHYYIEPVSDNKLFEYAIQGMLANLDPHSDYLDAASLRDLETATTGKFGGIGIEVIPQNGFIKIISPIDDTPAYKAGIKAGDLIIRIDNKLVGDMTLREAINMIRGASGSVVHLTILRKDEKKPLVFNITRQIIKVPTIKSEFYKDGYGYIRLSFFQNETKRDLSAAIAQLQQNAKGNLKGIILDLRNNPGGLLDAAIDVTNMFLNSKQLKYGGLIVYTKGRLPNADIKAVANGSDVLKGIPIVVLINDGSASAAEIVSGALQDQKRATVVGVKSFGKASVQTVLPIDEDSAIKLTTALYYTPSGRSIQAKGIVPDITIPDLKIPPAQNSDDDNLAITEVDLNKHLVDSSKASVAQQMVETDKKEQDLLYSDFQLYQALNILKALYAASDAKIRTK